jgi:hypothetical protein
MRGYDGVPSRISLYYVVLAFLPYFRSSLRAGGDPMSSGGTMTVDGTNGLRHRVWKRAWHGWQWGFGEEYDGTWIEGRRPTKLTQWDLMLWLLCI